MLNALSFIAIMAVWWWKENPRKNTLLAESVVAAMISAGAMPVKQVSALIKTIIGSRCLLCVRQCNWRCCRWLPECRFRGCNVIRGRTTSIGIGRSFAAFSLFSAGGPVQYRMLVTAADRRNGYCAGDSLP